MRETNEWTIAGHAAGTWRSENARGETCILSISVGGRRVSVTCWDDLVPVVLEIENGAFVEARGEVRMFRGRGGWQYGLDAREVIVHDEHREKIVQREDGTVDRTEERVRPRRTKQYMATDGGTWPRRARRRRSEPNDMEGGPSYLNDVPFPE